METVLRGVSSAVRREWESIAAERDPELHQEALLNFAARQEQAGRWELAARVYAEVVGADSQASTAAVVEGGGSRGELSLRQRAQRRLDAIVGRGAFGPRAEFLLRNFSEQAADPSALLAMGVAGAAFRLTRLAALSRLAGSAQPGLLVRLFGAGRVASLAGFAVEAPAFVAIGRLGNAALGREQEWTARALGRDLASSYLVLGGLKLTGWSSGAAAETFGASLRARTLFQQGGMLTGILLGHRAEEWAGLREHRDGATTLTDSLALLLQFNVAGRLSRHALGENFGAWERRLDLQAGAMEGRLAAAPVMRPRWVTAAAATGAAEPKLPDVVMMVQGPGSGDGNGNQGGPPGRRPTPRPTLLGLGQSSRLPAPTAPEAPRYSEAPPHPLEGLSPGTRYLRAGNIKLTAQDPLSRLFEALDLYFRHYRDPVVVSYEGYHPFDTRSEHAMRVELSRLFREHEVPNDVTVSVLLAKDNLVLHYRRVGLRFEIDRVDLKPPERVSANPPPAPGPKSTAPARPLARPKTPPPAPALEMRGDSATAHDFAGVKEAMRRFLQSLDPASAMSPAIRLTQGRIDEPGLHELAVILGEHPLAEGRKISIYWMEKGGGTVSFLRQGEVIRADWKSFQHPAESLVLVPVESRLGQWKVYRGHELPRYRWDEYRGYEPTVERESRRLFARLAYPGEFDKMASREEGAALRGERLGRLALQWLKANHGSGRTLTPAAQDDFVALHRLLERSQAYLDLGTLQRFRERLGVSRVREWDEHVDLFNRALTTARREQLIPLHEFGSRLPGEAQLPLSDLLRAVFCEQLFKSRGDARIPLENNGLLRDPRRMAAVFRDTLRSRAIPLLATFKLIERTGAGETPATLLAQNRGEMNDHAGKLRDDLEFFLADWNEFGRILLDNRGAFHRVFLGEIFEGPRSMRDLYQQAYKGIQDLPKEIRRSQRLEHVPSWEEIQKMMRGSRP